MPLSRPLQSAQSNVVLVTQARPHVLFLNRSFWPDTEATGQLLAELTTDLTSWFDVTVISGQPNHRDETIDPVAASRNVFQGVKVYRAWHTRFSKHSTVGRLLNLITFTVTAWRTANQLKQRPDVIVTQSDPFFLPLIGRRLHRRFGGCPLVCYLQDIYPDVAVVVGKIREGWLTRWIRNRLFDVYRNAARVIVLSQDMRQRCESYGVHPESIDVVPNWTDTRAVTPVKLNNEFRLQQGLVGKFVVMYSGNMGLVHNLDEFIEAARLLRDRPEIEWVFIGDGAQRTTLFERVNQLGLPQVRFLPYQSRSFLAQSLSAADVHLLSVCPGASACVMPSKFYGILASSTPTVAIAEPDTELSELIQNQEVGFACNPGDAPSVASRIRELADNPELARRLGTNARRLAESHFSRSRQTAKIAELLHRILKLNTPESLQTRLLPTSDSGMDQANKRFSPSQDSMEPALRAANM